VVFHICDGEIEGEFKVLAVGTLKFRRDIAIEWFTAFLAMRFFYSGEALTTGVAEVAILWLIAEVAGSWVNKVKKPLYLLYLLHFQFVLNEVCVDMIVSVFFYHQDTIE